MSSIPAIRRHVEDHNSSELSHLPSPHHQPPPQSLSQQHQHTRATTTSMWKPSSSSQERRQLPMYKDKPENGGVSGALSGILGGTSSSSSGSSGSSGLSSSSSSSPSRKKRKTIGLAVIFLGLLYFVYNIGRATSRSDSNGNIFSWGQAENRKSTPTSWPQKQEAVKQAFLHSWNGYRKYAYGMDEYHPTSKKGKNMGPKPLGWIIVDSLDTLYLMKCEKELKQAQLWVDKQLNYNMDYEVNTFETTIRMLGGLLSAHYLTKDDMYLNKAVDLGSRLLGAFESGSGIPYASVNLHSSVGKASHADAGASSTAEASTLQLEFKYLAYLTGETLFWEKAERVMKVMDDNHVESGLVPIFIQPNTGKFQGKLIRLGSRGDSYYEYLLKQYLQTNEEEPIYKEMYDEAIQGIKKYMVRQSEPNKLTYIGELDNGIEGAVSPKMDHLVCFAGGMLALGATNGIPIDEARRKEFWTTRREEDFQLAMEITHTCYETYRRTETGLGPEIVYFNNDPEKTEDFIIKPNDAHNLQRPETVESLFILWRLTKNPIYREWGWKIFESFEKWTKIPGDAGYASVNNVNVTPPPFRDNMESFWLSETLKYLYLLFDDRDHMLPLTDVVFNTEAHPLPKFSMDPFFQTGWRRQISSSMKPPTAQVNKPLAAAEVSGAAAAAAASAAAYPDVVDPVDI